MKRKTSSITQEDDAAAAQDALSVAPKMRRGRHLPSDDANEPVGEDRQFVVALARGMGILAAFRLKDGPLGNSELAERTGAPAATVSRLTHTLTKLGYLTFDPRAETYDLGGSLLSVAHIALGRLSARRIALPLMQELATRSNANVGLGVRDRGMMVYAEACEGSALVGLRLFAGSRIPIATSAMGRAYLAAIPMTERETFLAEARQQFGSEWGTVERGIEKARKDIHTRGYCMSLGEWQKDIHGIAVPLVEPGSGHVYSINLGGPAYMLPESDLVNEHGPNLVKTRDEILRRLSPVATPGIHSKNQ